MGTDASTTGSDGDKVSCYERVARLLAAIFRQELPQANKATLKLLCVRGTAVLDSTSKNVVSVQPEFWNNQGKPLVLRFERYREAKIADDVCHYVCV